VESTAATFGTDRRHHQAITVGGEFQIRAFVNIKNLQYTGIDHKREAPVHADQLASSHLTIVRSWNK
jgi:hypothetical protein